MNTPITIGITDANKFETYKNWAQNNEPDVEIIKLGYKDNNFAQIHRCHGIILSGGGDMHPRYYHKPEYLEFCDKDVDIERDEFEWKVLEYTEKNQIPLLGICRGLQVGNVFFGGTLIPDLPAWGKDDHSKLPDGQGRKHNININEQSQLFTITHQISGAINSYHHQAIDAIGNGLMISALSNDGVVEAVERADKEDKSFLCMVQWHPERIENPADAFSQNIRSAFINAIRINRLQTVL